MSRGRFIGISGWLVGGTLLLVSPWLEASGKAAIDQKPNSYIVQARDLEAAARAVRSAGGEVTHEPRHPGRRRQVDRRAARQAFGVVRGSSP